ncbi:hypothetical protein SK128_016396, partial [Halocaridina rubra]
VAGTNAWLLYNHEAKMLNEEHMPLKNFCHEITSAMVKVNKMVSVGRPLFKRSPQTKVTLKEQQEKEPRLLTFGMTALITDQCSWDQRLGQGGSVLTVPRGYLVSSAQSVMCSCA